jgi:hypothetical protein
LNKTTSIVLGEREAESWVLEKFLLGEVLIKAQALNIPDRTASVLAARLARPELGQGADKKAHLIRFSISVSPPESGSSSSAIIAVAQCSPEI